MPKGFLVKRTKHSGSYSYRVRHSSDEERSESGSDQEYVHTNFGSPDSGYSASPISGAFRERFGYDSDFIAVRSPVGPSPCSSPLTVSTTNYPSPLYYATFDRLTVRSNTAIDYSTPAKLDRETTVKTATPLSPSKKRTNSDQNVENKIKTPKKPKAARKINFDEDTSSPVSGTIIRALSDLDVDGKRVVCGVDGKRVVCGDIDSKFNCVEVTAEAKAELDKIDNKIGEYVCQLCKDVYGDAFQLAQHRCSRIVHVEYRCPECDKAFNCPANLASHRRWHKPRPPPATKPSAPSRILPAGPPQARAVDGDTPTYGGTTLSPTQDDQFSCDKCKKKFRRHAYLRKHLQTHVTDSIFVCQFCSKVFPNDNARAKHEVSHVNGKELTCTLCYTSFPNKIVLEKHVRHHGDETYACKHCPSTFCSSPGLTRHINKCHPSENRQVIMLQPPVTRPC